MGLVEDFWAERDRLRQPQAVWPVGPGEVVFDGPFGHDQSEFSPPEYGDYLATSNEVYAAVSLRARLMSGLKLGLFTGTGSEKREITTGPAWNLLRRPNPFWTYRRLTRMDEMSMGVWGESFWAVHRSGGTPAEIWWMKPSRVRPVPHATGYISEFLYESVTGDVIPFRPDEVIWFRYPNPLDEFSPLSPLAAARLAADTASAMTKSNRNLFNNGMQLGGLIAPTSDQVTYSEKQAQELEKLLDKRWSGVDKRHKWAVLRFDAQMKNLGVTPKDAEFVNGLGLSARQVYNAYGVPSPLLNDMAYATLSNAREYERLLWSHALVPDASLRSDEVEVQLLPMFSRSPGRVTPDHAEHDFTSVPALQESESEVWAREAQAIERGALTINEWRKSKGRPPVKWGDVYWAPVNKAAVTDAESQPNNNPDAPDLTAEDAVDIAEAKGAEASLDRELAALNHWEARRLLAAFNGHGGQ